MDKELSFPKHRIKFLLLENIHQVAFERLREAGYSVEGIGRSLPSEELLSELRDVHVLGIRSKTKITREQIEGAKKLMAIGCFGVGTNQVDLGAATSAGIPVFNAPYGNTRSVAELAVGNIIALARKSADRNHKMHQGFWDKTAKGVHEVRDKVLGIIGYGHIGQQVGILAEALGIRIIFFDMMRQLPLGNSRQIESLDELLRESDFVSLHVPALRSGKALFGEKELRKMKKGSYILNTSRGSLIDLAALKKVLEEGHLAGAALDVFPDEPGSNKEEFHCELAGMENVILTPHIGGSTEEAQYNIGLEVAACFQKFIDTGATFGAVNFPQVGLPLDGESHRILNVHKNVPGVLTEVNKIISDVGANINAQYLNTYKDVGYLVVDVNKEVSDELKDKISSLSSSIKTRILY
jgi:D-3-phosphoglycerate dehydrogenase